MAGNKKYKDLRYLFIRGLIQQENKQRRFHFLKSAAECTSRAIVSLELSEDSIKSVHQAEKLQGIGGETKKRLQTYSGEGEFDDNPPKLGKFVSSAGAILLALLEATEKALADDSRQDEVVLVPEPEVKGRARLLSEEPFLKDHDDGLCAAWWRMEVLIKRDFVKRRTLHKQPVYQLLPLGMEAARHVKTHFTYPSGSDPSKKTVTSGQNNFLYTNDKGLDGVILQVDHRELGGDRLGLGQLCDLLAGEGVIYRTRQLKTGDYQWVWRCEGQERDLPCIAERKRVDDMARTLKEGRFWTQVTKMKTFKAVFEERGVACVVHYLVEGNPENYVVRCGDGCQGVGKCGHPSLQQVKCAFRDLAGDKDLVAQATDDLQATVAVIASITTDLQQRTRKGEFDHLVALELDQSHDSKIKVQTPLKCDKFNGSKVTGREHPVCVDSDSSDSLDAGLHHQSPLGSKVKQTERSPKANIYPIEEISSRSRNRYCKENTPSPSLKCSNLRGRRQIPAMPDDDGANLDLDQHKKVKSSENHKSSKRTYENFQTNSVSDLNMPNHGSCMVDDCEDWHCNSVTDKTPPQSSRRRELPPLEPLVQYHCMESYAGLSPSKRSRETSGTVYKPKMTSLSNSDVGVYRPNTTDQTNSFERETTASYRPKISSIQRPGDVYKPNMTDQKNLFQRESPIGQYRPKMSSNQRPRDEYRPTLTSACSPQRDGFKSYSSRTSTYRPKIVDSKNDRDVYKPNVSNSSYGDEYANTFHSRKTYWPKMSTSQGFGQTDEPQSSSQHQGNMYNCHKYKTDSDENPNKSSANDHGGYKSPASQSSANDRGGYKLPASHFEHVHISPDVNSFGKRKIVNLDTTKQTKFVPQQISMETSAMQKATHRKTIKVPRDNVWLNDNSSDSSNDEDIDTAVVHKPVLREVTPKSKLCLDREADSDSDSLPHVGLGQEEDYDCDDLPDPTWQLPASEGHRHRTSPVSHRQRTSLPHRTQTNTGDGDGGGDGGGGTALKSPGPTKGTKGHPSSSQSEDQIRLVNSVLPHVSRTKILLALECHSGNVDLCVASLLDDYSQ